MQKFGARIVAQEFGITESSGNRYVEWVFMLIGGKRDGEIVRRMQAFTEKTVEQIRSAYRAMGWDGISDFTKLDVRRSLTKTVILTMGEEEYTDNRTGTRRTREAVQFVNPATSVREPLSPEAREDLFREFQGMGGKVPCDADGVPLSEAS